MVLALAVVAAAAFAVAVEALATVRSLRAAWRQELEQEIESVEGRLYHAIECELDDRRFPQ